MKYFIGFIKKETVLVISFFLALASMFIVAPNKGYISYIDFRTLAILLGMMFIMSGLEKLFVFQQIGETLISLVSDIRMITLLLISLCFISSMFITNDVSLLTFVPFTIVVLNMAGKKDYLIPIIILETVAANLGSMLMPMGNPQNLYLYTLSQMSIASFVLMMLPYAMISLILLIILGIFMVKKETVSLNIKHEFKRNTIQKVRIISYLICFVIALLVVARVLDYRIGFVLITLTVLFLDTGILLHVDYSLIFTFIFLFIFIGNLKQLDEVSNWLRSITSGNEVIVSVIASQFISNVPAAILLSGFTDNIKSLIIGTNLGGLGTLIASMASLISFKLYLTTINPDKKKYVVLFSIINVAILLILLLAVYLFKLLAV